MTPDKTALVQESFAKLEPIAAQAGELFYARLFEVAPEVRGMFADDVSPQAKKLMAVLGVVVRGLADLNRIIPAVETLARTHVDYGVKAAHYAAVGAALIETLRAGLGDAFTPDVRAAWDEAYATLAEVMIKAAYHEGIAAR
jgi:hemoglobin-like flavoprotein